jgi:hypothetical protein
VISGIDGLQQRHKHHIGDVRAEVEKSFRNKSFVVQRCYVFSVIDTDSSIGKSYHAMVEFTAEQMAQRATMQQEHTINGYSVTIRPWKKWYDTIDDRLLSFTITVARLGCAISVQNLSLQTTSKDVAYFFSDLLKRHPSIVVQCGIIQSCSSQYSKEAYVEFEDPSIVHWIVHLDSCRDGIRNSGCKLRIRPWNVNRRVRPFLSKHQHDQYRRDTYNCRDEVGGISDTSSSSENMHRGDSYKHHDEVGGIMEDQNDRSSASLIDDQHSNDNHYCRDSHNHCDEAGVEADYFINDGKEAGIADTSVYSSGTEEGELTEKYDSTSINDRIPDFTASNKVASKGTEFRLVKTEDYSSDISLTEAKAEEDLSNELEDADTSEPGEELIEVNKTKKDVSCGIIEVVTEDNKTKNDENSDSMEELTEMDRNKEEDTLVEKPDGENIELLQRQIKAIQVQVDALKSQYGQLELSFFNHRSIMADDHRRFAQKLHDETTQRMDAEKRICELEAKLHSM